jgi:hypothetical protein
MDPSFALENRRWANGAAKIRKPKPQSIIRHAADGTRFTGPQEFRQRCSPPGRLRDESHGEAGDLRAGRGLEAYDMPVVRKIMRAAAPTDYRWSAIILEIVKSTHSRCG